MAARLVGSRNRRQRMSPAFRLRLLVRQEPTPWLDRRSALLAGLGVATGVLGTALAAHVGSPVTQSRPIAAPTTASHGQETTSRGSIEPSPQLARWVDTGLRLAEMSSVCTHLPCELVWVPDKKLLKCPCHGLAFDVEGESLSEDGLPLPALPFVMTRVRGDGGIEVLGTERRPATCAQVRPSP